MSSMLEWIKRSWKWLLVGVAAALSVALLGRKSTSLALAKDWAKEQAEQNTRRIADAVSDQKLASEKKTEASVSKTVGGMTDAEVDKELHDRGLD